MPVVVFVPMPKSSAITRSRRSRLAGMKLRPTWLAFLFWELKPIVFPTSI
jgi:hypothetical protein